MTAVRAERQGTPPRGRVARVALFFAFAALVTSCSRFGRSWKGTERDCRALQLLAGATETPPSNRFREFFPWGSSSSTEYGQSVLRAIESAHEAGSLPQVGVPKAELERLYVAVATRNGGAESDARGRYNQFEREILTLASQDIHARGIFQPAGDALRATARNCGQ